MKSAFIQLSDDAYISISKNIFVVQGHIYNIEKVK